MEKKQKNENEAEKPQFEEESTQLTATSVMMKR